MEPPTDFLAALQKGTCTFFVGPQKKKLEIHTHVVAAQSKVFDEMMNGQKEATVDKVVNLPDVDPDTFLKFINFCYFANYKFDPKKTLAKTEKKKKTVKGPITSNAHLDKNYVTITFEVLKVTKQLKFHCHACQFEVDLATNAAFFPFCCQKCVVQTEAYIEFEPNDPYCTRCGRVSKSGMGIICETCLVSLGVKLGDRKLESLYRNTLNALKKMSYDALLSTDCSMYQTVQECRTRLGEPEASDNFVEHAKVFVFADVYKVDALRGLALARLVSDFNLFDESKDDIEKIVDLIRYIYDTIEYPGPLLSLPSSSESRLFYRIAMSFAARHAKLLMASKDFRILLTEDEDMMLDFIGTVAEV